MISLYIHIPFCKHKCAYCSFYSSVNLDIEDYCAAIIRCVQEYSAKTRQKVDTVYVGGGTPSVLPPKSLCDIFSAVNESFDIVPEAEITVEANPESADSAFLSAAVSCGVNRVSLGVQSLVDSELNAIGRIHSSSQAIRAVQLAQQSGISNVSCDLIFGLPGQSAESFEYSLKRLLALEICHVSCYNLQIEPGTPLEWEKIQVPDEDRQREMYELACRTLEGAGYQHYEISNFCLPGFKSKHNSSYWTGKDYLGLGPSAHSKIGDTRCSFDADTGKFISRDSFDFDVSERICDPLFEKIMLSLRTDSGLETKLIPHSARFIERLCGSGLAHVRDGRLILTDRGYYLSNSIISEIGAIEC